MAAKTANRWAVLAAAGVFNALVGAVYVWSVFNIPLAHEHGWSAPEVAFAYSLYICIESVAGFIAGALQARVKASVIVLAGGLLFATGWFLAGCVDTVVALCLCFSVFGGLGSGTIYNTSVAVATKWFPDKRGLANGICVGATGLSPLLFAPLANAFIQAFGVGLSFNACGALFAVGTLAAFRLMKNPPDGWAPPNMSARGSQPRPTPNPAAGMATRRMVATPAFWALWLLFACAASGGMMVVGNASGIGQQLIGLTPAEAAAQVGIFAVANFAGRLAFGGLSDRFGRFPMMGVALAVTALVMFFGFSAVEDFLSLTAVLCVAGACFGGVMAIVPALCADLFGTAHFGQNYALLFSGYSCASVIGPMLAANVLAATGTYDAAFTGAGILTCVGIALVFASAALSRTLREKR